MTYYKLFYRILFVLFILPFGIEEGFAHLSDPKFSKLSYRVSKAKVILDAEVLSVKKDLRAEVLRRNPDARGNHRYLFKNIQSFEFRPIKLILPSSIRIPFSIDRYGSSTFFRHLTPIKKGDRAIWLFRAASNIGLSNPEKYPIDSNKEIVYGLFWSKGKTFWEDNSGCSETQFVASLKAQKISAATIADYRKALRNKRDDKLTRPYAMAIAMIESCIPQKK